MDDRPALGLTRADLDVVFFDAGNTLVSMDFAWVSDELGKLGVEVAHEALVRADWRARPRVSERCGKNRRTEGGDLFVSVLTDLLAGVPIGGDAAIVAAKLAAALRVPGYTARLWSYALPGVRQGLVRLRDAGLRLVVVSNSDGTVAAAIERAGLADCFEAVVDSGAVGAEKPDRRIFDHAVRLAGAIPQRVLHVGDLYTADVLGARGAGLHAALVDPHADYGYDVDCPVIEGVADLADKLLR